LKPWRTVSFQPSSLRDSSKTQPTSAAPPTTVVPYRFPDASAIKGALGVRPEQTGRPGGLVNAYSTRSGDWAKTLVERAASPKSKRPRTFLHPATIGWR